MSFFNEMILKIGLKPEDAIGGWKFTLLDGQGALLEGHKGIVSYGENEVIARLKKGSLQIMGEKLKVAELNDSELFIKGKIIKIERVEP
jgi:sporulation protein YqfC